MKPMLAATALVLVVAVSASALEINKYNQLSLEDKSRYMIMLVKGTEQILRDQGRPDQARRVGHLFNETPAGEQMPRGLKQFGEDLITAEQLQQKSRKVFHVEHALLLTYKKLGIEVEQRKVMALGNDFKPFAK
jgi:hypothetical protein